jgi:hypothetical protein
MVDAARCAGKCLEKECRQTGPFFQKNGSGLGKAEPNFTRFILKVRFFVLTAVGMLYHQEHYWIGLRLARGGC